MEKFKRSLFFWSLVLIFAITTPIVVLKAQGYQFDWKRGVFVHSGAISFKSNPQAVSVTMNGKLNEDRSLNRINNSINLPGLMPGDYDLEISAPNFYPWNKKIAVHSGVATEFWNIILTRINYEKTAFPETAGIEKFFTSPGNHFLATTQTANDNFLVKILDLNNSTISDTFTFSGWNFIEDSRKENIEWSPDEKYLSVPVKKVSQDNNKSSSNNQTNPYNYFIADIDGQTSFNLNEYLGKNEIDKMRWDPHEKGYFFFLEGSTLYRANIFNKDISLITDNVVAYDISSSYVYFLQTPNNLVFKTSLDGKEPKTQITSSFPVRDDDSPIKKMIVYDESRISFLDQNQSLYTYNESGAGIFFKKLGDNIQQMHYSDDGKKMLFWTDYEISVFYTRNWDVQPIRSENELVNITRYSEPLKNIQWYRDYEHIIFSTGKYVKIVELDPRDSRISNDLLTTQTDASFINHNYSLGKLFFTDINNGESTLYSIEFPEPKSFFGLVGG